MRAILKTMTLGCLFMLTACASGGGTAGTGEVGIFGILIHGTVVDANGAPLGNVSVSSLEFGEMTDTDSNGKYSFVPQYSAQDMMVTLELQTDIGVGRVEITIPSLETTDLLLDLEFDQKNNSIKVLTRVDGS